MEPDNVQGRNLLKRQFMQIKILLCLLDDHFWITITLNYKRVSEASQKLLAQITYANPWVLEGLLCCDPLGRVDGQHLVDEVLGLGGNRIPLRRRKL